MRIKFLLFFLTVLIVSGSQNLIAQNKRCDMELKFNSPQNGQTFLVGDTAVVTFKLINHGPDNILPQDTIFFSFNYYPNITYIPHDTIPHGDSIVSIPYGYFINNGSLSSTDKCNAVSQIIAAPGRQ